MPAVVVVVQLVDQVIQHKIINMVVLDFPTMQVLQHHTQEQVVEMDMKTLEEVVVVDQMNHLLGLVPVVPESSSSHTLHKTPTCFFRTLWYNKYFHTHNHSY